MNIAKNVDSLVVGWELGEYGKPRDTPLPWPPDLSALALDTELAQMMNNPLNTTSFVCVSTRVCVCVYNYVCLSVFPPVI